MRTLPLLLVLAACPKSDDTGEPVMIDELSFSKPSGDAVLSIPVERIELGIVDPIDDGLSYNPNFQTEVGVRWVAARNATLQADGAWLLRFGDGIQATLTEQVVDGRWSYHLTPGAEQPDTGFMRITAVGSATEGFYGLGEYFDRPHHRGHVRSMHFEPDGAIESGHNEAHVPIPFVIGTSGWGLFVQDDHMMTFEVATEADDEVRVTVGTGVMSDEGLIFHVYTADHPLDLTREYYETTGYPTLPAPWALGPILWRDENIDQAEVIGDIDAMRTLDLPASALWIDRPYATGVNSFDFKPSDYPDPAAMIAHAHDNGLRMGVWHTPYVQEDLAEPFHSQAADDGYHPPTHPPAFTDWGPIIDLSNPDARAWWTGNVGAYTDDLGIEFFKLDFAQDVVPAIGHRRLPWAFHDGTDERTMHREYQRLYHQTYRDALGEGTGFLLNRSGSWGDQTVGAVIWPGDIDATLTKHREVFTTPNGEEVVGVGGVPAAVAASIGLGPSGYPFFGSDTGGYLHSPPDKETFTRWFEHTALSSVMQIGMSSSDVAWEYVRDWDDEMLGWYRDYTRLHLRLFPYEWTYAQQIAQTGHPIQRPLGLAHPELGQHFDFDYLFGEHLLVAPVVQAGATTRDVTLPEGDWIDWFDGDVLSAGTHTVDAPLGKLPLFLKRGGIVPMLRPTIDTLSPVPGGSDIESFDNDPGQLTVRVFPGEASSFELYDGTVLTAELSGSSATLGYTAGDAFTHGAVFEVVGLGSEMLTGELAADGSVTVP